MKKSFMKRLVALALVIVSVCSISAVAFAASAWLGRYGEETLYLDNDPGVDGYFGKETKAALAAFQKTHGLYASGEAGDMTKAVLWEEYVDLLMTQGYKR